MNLYQDVFFRSLDLLRGRRTIERLHFLRKSQHWERSELESWQLERMNALLSQARENSAYYAMALAPFQLPLRSLDEVAKLPVLNKQNIRENFDALQCRNLPRSRFVKSRTGGSTGEPTYYFWDKQGMDWNRASVYRSAEWAGVALGERTVHMSGSHFDYTQAQALHNRLVYFLQRYRDYSVAFLTQELLERYFVELNKFRPSSIWGYASGLNVFAQYIEKNHPGAPFEYLKAIVTSSETLLPQHRQRINRVFGADKVHDNYGSREMYIGAECHAHDGYHLHADVLYVEVVDKLNRPCAPGEVGRILLTDLANHAFPFIRYEIGDVGSMAGAARCKCGVTLPRLQSVQGRVADLIVLPDRVLTPPNFATLFSDFPGIRSYQIRQDKIDKIDVFVVPGEAYEASVGEYVIGAIRQMVGGQATVELHEVPDIAVPESGKRRYVVSAIAHQAA
jgi:phenylacetate-CoA ligase